MKRVIDINNLIEAHMLADALREQGIEPILQGETANRDLGEPIVILVVDEKVREAEAVIAGIMEAQPDVEERPPAEPLRSSGSSGRFYTGIVLGALIGYGWFALRQGTYSGEELSTSWDNNGDGIEDAWGEYTNGEMVKGSYDTNYDGEPDEWSYLESGLQVRVERDRNRDGNADLWWYYEPHGELARAAYDDDFDGEAESWEHFERGERRQFYVDRDGDGRNEEWGVYENELVRRQSFSFQSDDVADKQIVYEDGRRVRIEYDRNRDGDFEEMHVLNEFEEVVEIRRDNR